MNGYSEIAKKEITALSFSMDCCKRAFLSALVHTCGTLNFSREGMRIVIQCASEGLAQRVIVLIDELFGFHAQINERGEEITVTGELTAVLLWLGIFKKTDNGIEVERGVLPSLVEEEHCAVNYLRGAFLGGGSMSLKSGYHLEFALNNPVIAENISALLSRFSIESKTTARKDKTVVYIKDGDGVSDALALMGASEAVLSLNSEAIIRQVRRNANRRNNCELANIEKTVNASVRQVEDITLIDKTIGIVSLDAKLQVVAKARIENPDDSFSFLAEVLNISKSTLKNRLNKLGKIAKEIREKEKK